MTDSRIVAGPHVLRARLETGLAPKTCGYFRGVEGVSAEIGADSRNRTVDPIITNDVLYQLS